MVCIADHHAVLYQKIHLHRSSVVQPQRTFQLCKKRNISSEIMLLLTIIRERGTRPPVKYHPLVKRFKAKEIPVILIISVIRCKLKGFHSPVIFQFRLYQALFRQVFK